MKKRAYQVVMLLGLLALLAGSVAPVWGAPRWEQQRTQSLIHLVQWGENLTLIARRYGVSITSIVQANGLGNPNFVYVGQRLVIPSAVPPPGVPSGTATTYLVRAGDTLSAIASRFGTTVNAITSLNGLFNPNLIYVGQRLQIPGGAPESPGGSCTYVVKAGDNLTRIALTHRTTVWAIAIANNLANPSFIWVGQRLTIPSCSPGGGPTPTPQSATPTPGPGTTPTPTAGPPAGRMKTPAWILVCLGVLVLRFTSPARTPPNRTVRWVRIRASSP